MAGRRDPSWLEADANLTDLYDANATNLVVFFTRRVWDAQVAMDLAAETFAQAVESAPRFRGEDSSAAQAWLFGIAANKLRRFHRDGAIEDRALRRLKLEPPVLSDEEFERIEELAGTAELRDLVRDALARLSPEQRDALELRVVEELPYSEVAARLGTSEQAIRARVSRGLQNLAEQLEPARSIVEGA
ncbi:sigma-70 family RNA polymerase sigma factor [Thermoleophilia bacterium SCSIO 60948]|nr:sigma-70 family RNA polymerase sigma factor [Thermoleophilia bacterium SCSIO 60948]